MNKVVVILMGLFIMLILMITILASPKEVKHTLNDAEFQGNQEAQIENLQYQLNQCRILYRGM